MGVLGNLLVDSQFVAIFPVVSADSESKSWLSWLAVSPEAGITSAGWLLGFGLDLVAGGSEWAFLGKSAGACTANGKLPFLGL